jgi:hypothetical protein
MLLILRIKIRFVESQLTAKIFSESSPGHHRRPKSAPRDAAGEKPGGENQDGENSAWLAIESALLIEPMMTIDLAMRSSLRSIVLVIVLLPAIELVMSSVATGDPLQEWPRGFVRASW